MVYNVYGAYLHKVQYASYSNNGKLEAQEIYGDTTKFKLRQIVTTVLFRLVPLEERNNHKYEKR